MRELAEEWGYSVNFEVFKAQISILTELAKLYIFAYDKPSSV
jgi:hypothetical protein